MNSTSNSGIVSWRKPCGVVCEGFDDSVMLAPGSVMTGSHEMYKVFTPFKNAFIKRLKEALPECVTAPP